MFSHVLKQSMRLLFLTPGKAVWFGSMFILQAMVLKLQPPPPNQLLGSAVSLSDMQFQTLSDLEAAGLRPSGVPAHEVRDKAAHAQPYLCPLATFQTL